MGYFKGNYKEGNTMIDVTTTIRENRQISPSFYLITFDWQEEWGAIEPGAFLEVRVSDTTTPLLRRPFGFSHYDAAKGVAGFIYERRGIGTKMLTNIQAGDTIEMIAPLGTTFGVTGTPQKLIAIGGGVGLGPILFAAQKAADKGIPCDLILGYREASLIPTLKELEALNPIFCTDDGSAGFSGNVVEYLQTQTAETLKDATIWSCGPIPMLAACHRFAEEKSLISEVSMEEMMACGVGACAGCVVETASGDLTRVCKEGPVFESRELAWI